MYSRLFDYITSLKLIFDSNFLFIGDVKVPALLSDTEQEPWLNPRNNFINLLNVYITIV